MTIATSYTRVTPGRWGGRCVQIAAWGDTVGETGARRDVSHADAAALVSQTVGEHRAAVAL